MSHHKLDWMALAKGMFVTIGVLAILTTFYAAGPWLETKYWPVLSKLEFLEIEPVTSSTTQVRVKFTKRRECEYMGMAWYVASDLNGVTERVSMVPVKDPDDTSNPNRMVGTQYAGPWRIGMALDDIRARSYVLVYHRCHPFWTTTTIFYP